VGRNYYSSYKSDAYSSVLGTHLTMGQYAGGTSAQPFKTEKDYTNFLKRMDTYSIWLDSAMVYMKKESKRLYPRR
jgi:uncharacterized protein (DUF885 family)